MENSSCPTECDSDCDAACHEWHAVPWKRHHDPVRCEEGLMGPHRLMQVGEGPDMVFGDVCEGCSDPDNGVWVPVSFCDEANKDAENYYKEIYG